MAVKLLLYKVKQFFWPEYLSRVSLQDLFASAFSTVLKFVIYTRSMRLTLSINRPEATESLELL